MGVWPGTKPQYGFCLFGGWGLQAVLLWFLVNQVIQTCCSFINCVMDPPVVGIWGSVLCAAFEAGAHWINCDKLSHGYAPCECKQLGLQSIIHTSVCGVRFKLGEILLHCKGRPGDWFGGDCSAVGRRRLKKNILLITALLASILLGKGTLHKMSAQLVAALVVNALQVLHKSRQFC